MRRAGHEQMRGVKSCEGQRHSIKWTKSSDSWCISRGWCNYCKSPQYEVIKPNGYI